MQTTDLETAFSPTGAADLAAAVATRVCHDLAGLLGTLAGTLEMADEDQGAVPLACETAQELAARLRLLRAAWGGGGGPLNAAAIEALAQGLPGIARLRLDMSALTDTLAETPARIALCLLLAALPGLPRGGAIVLGPASRGGVSIRLNGPAAAWPASLAQCAASEAATQAALAAPRGLAAPLACLIATAAGWRITVDGTDATATPT